MNFSDYPLIRIISFPVFRSLGRFPRFPDDANSVISLKDLSKEEYERSLMIFVSHCWLRGWSGAEGWDGRPHPDSANGDKYKLCVDGIDKMLNTMTPGMTNCYLWIDFGCIDQNGDPAGELKMLDKIVGVCDCLFTPLHDKDHDKWESPSLLSNLYDDYPSPVWNGNPFSYLNRGWCRIEMFYAVNIPLLEDSADRRAKFTAGLAYHRSQGIRPHVLYGTKEMIDRRGPMILPPLQNSYFEKYNPIRGTVSVEKDREKIVQLVKELEPYMKKAKIGYEGDYKDGKKHGKGRFTFANGDVHEGGYEDNKMHGKGKFTFSDGNVYEGDFEDNKMHGKGKFIFADGNVYEGDFKKDIRHGTGRFTFANGDVYEGNFCEGKLHGNGKFTFSDGDAYEGDHKDNKMHGKGKFKFSDGNIYEGDFTDDKRNGKGTISFANGDVYEGDFSDDKMHGKGKYTYANGNVYDGEYQDNKMHGNGKLTLTNGKVLLQTYRDGKLTSGSSSRGRCLIC